VSSFYLILALVFSLIIAIVAIANTEPVTVNYLFGRADISLIVLILGSAFAGAVVMGMLSLFRSIKAALAFRHLRQEKETLQKQVKELENDKVFLEAELNKALSVPEEPEPEFTESETGAEQDEPGEEPGTGRRKGPEAEPEAEAGEGPGEEAGEEPGEEGTDEKPS